MLNFQQLHIETNEILASLPSTDQECWSNLQSSSESRDFPHTRDTQEYLELTFWTKNLIRQLSFETCGTTLWNYHIHQRLLQSFCSSLSPISWKSTVKICVSKLTSVISDCGRLLSIRFFFIYNVSKFVDCDK